MNEITTKKNIEDTLHGLQTGSLADGATRFWAALGYTSERTLHLDGDTPADFSAFTAGSAFPFRPDRAYKDKWNGIHGLFQLQDADLSSGGRSHRDLFADAAAIDKSLVKSYLFFALDIKSGVALTRTELSAISREINRPFPMPVLLLVRQKDGDGNATLTLAVQDRRQNKTNADHDVLEKVTLVKDVRLAKPHRAHVEILFDLHLDRVADEHRPANFDDLHKAWSRVLDASALNKRFYQELANWYFWARTRVVFPGATSETEKSQAVIRLITRLIFVWFVREKGLVPEALFRARDLGELVVDFTKPDALTFYQAILQNLFFATLNAEKDDPKRKRRWKQPSFQGKNADRGQYDVWRYKNLLANPQTVENWLNDVPFLNGGLFECLPDVDGFSDDPKRAAQVPNELFFCEKRPCADCDLNAVYGTKNKRYEVEGLIDLLNHYKFTVDENTPIEEEIALDPELLGKVFENLLASYNPETATTARKQTGSFYTPREIVDYMVDEALVAYLGTQTGTEMDRLRRLIAYNDEAAADYLAPEEIDALVAAIDRVKILDPACGSGAFPMGALQKLVYLLNKLDPGDAPRWRETQRARAVAETAEAFRLGDKVERDRRLAEISDAFENNASDYGRKLYLIENGIYGVDIQPIAVQISKLRFFISLVIDQQADRSKPNFGIRPLPNLETKFVAANSLIRVARPAQLTIRSGDVEAIEAQLRETRRRYFEARGTDTKKKRVAEDDALREKLRAALADDGYPAASAKLIADWNPYNVQTAATFFDPEWMFGMAGGGTGDFDVVIANPPYVRHEDIKEQKLALSKAFPEIYNGTADLYTYFYGLAVRLLKPGGTLSFISPNKWFRAGYGGSLRHHITQTSRVRSIADFGELPVFESAATFPMVFVAQKGHDYAGEATFTQVKSLGPPYPDMNAVIAAFGFVLPSTAFNGKEWSLTESHVYDRLRQMERVGVPLSKYFSGDNATIYSGIKSGYNNAFLIDEITKDALIKADSKNARVIVRFVRGDDVRKWHIRMRNEYLIYTPGGFPIDEYPSIKAHLKKYEEKLKARAVQQPWWELQQAQNRKGVWASPKIVFPDIAKEPRFAYDAGGAYMDMTAFVLVSNDLFLLGVLNSDAVWKYLIKKSAVLGDAESGGRLRLKRQYVEQIPIPNATPAEKSAIAALVQKCLDAKKAEPADVSDWEREINALVANLYGGVGDPVSDAAALPATKEV